MSSNVIAFCEINTVYSEN